MLFTILSICYGLFSSVIIALLYLKWHFDHWTKRGVKGPKPRLLYGTFPKSSAGKCNLLEELHEIYLHYKAEHKFVGIYTSRKPKLFILDPQLAIEILTQHFKHFRDNESSQWSSPRIDQLRLCSPFVSIGDVWKERRSELMPVLTANKLRAFHAQMRASASKAVDFIAAAHSYPLDVKDLAHRYTANFMANFIWSIEDDTFKQSTSRSPIYQMGSAIISQSTDCVRYYGRTAAFPWLRKIRPVRFFPARCERFFQQLLAEVLQAREQERGDVIDHLRQLKEKKLLNSVQIAGHTTTVLIDGYETVAILIAHCLVLLAQNARVQQKLREQVRSISEEHSYEELSELPYLDQCIHETLRIFPPLATLFKLCTEAITLKNADNTELHLQPGDAVYISAYSFHRDADYYEHPEEFWPERFDESLGGVRKYRDMGVFLPFGNGPRQCPGMKLGLAEAKVAIAEIVRKFRLIPAAETRTDNKIAADTFLLTLDGNLKVIFEELN